MVRHPRLSQKSKRRQGNRVGMVKMKVTGMTLSVSGIRRKSIRGRMGGVRFQFCAKSQILHRDTVF